MTKGDVKRNGISIEMLVRGGRGVRRLKMDLNENGVGVVARKIHRGYRTTFLGKLDFASPAEYKITDL